MLYDIRKIIPDMFLLKFVVFVPEGLNGFRFGLERKNKSSRPLPTCGAEREGGCATMAPLSMWGTMGEAC